MRFNWLAVLTCVLLISGCDRPSSPPALPRSSLPPAGTLRLSSANLSPDIQSQFHPTAGLPTLCVKLEYAGPRTWLGIDAEGWHQGKKLGGGEGGVSINVPLSGDAAFGFVDGSSPEGKPELTIIESIPVHSDSTTGAVSGRIGTTHQYGVPPIKGRVCRTFQPRWPLEMSDGKEAIIWAVFVDEPLTNEEALSLEERARRADTAWLFKIRTADEKKENK